MKRSLIILVFMLMATSAVAEETEDSLDTIKPLMNRRLQTAISVWEDYIEALQAGDREKAKGYWSKETRRRYRAFDRQLPDFEKAVNLVRNDHLQIAEVNDHKDHIELRVRSSRKTYTTLERKIDYYKCDSGKEVGKLFGMAPATGLPFVSRSDILG